MKTIYPLFILFFLISCDSETDPGINRVKLSDLENLPIFTPEEQVDLSNPYGRPSIVAEINNEDFKDLHPNTFYNGLWYSVSTSQIATEAITLNFPVIQVGTYSLSDSSGFARAFFNGVPCSLGEISILQIKDDKVSGHFQFTSENDEIREGEFHDLSFDEEFVTPQNSVISATINGESWEAAVFDNVLGASFFNVQGFNAVGNVLIGVGSSYFVEPGVYDLLDTENSQTPGIWIQVAKNQPQLLSGTVILQSTDNGFIGRFKAEFEGYSISNGTFRLMTN